MQALLLVGWVTLASATLPDKATLKSVFVDGSGIKAPGFLKQAQIDTIDRELTIEYDFPAFQMGSDMPAPFNDTCGMSTISCPAQKFTVSPGMEVSTISVRGTAMTSAGDYMTAVAPAITFTMNAGKKYTFLMADGLSGANYWASGMMASVKQVQHYAVLNMNQSSGLSIDLKTMYHRPGNFIASTPNTYAFMVWEHTQTATMPEPIGTMNMGFTTQTWIQAAGIADASLVAMNYFKCYGNMFSRALLKSSPNPMIAAAQRQYGASTAPTCTAGGFSSSDKMCMGAMGATASAGATSMGASLLALGSALVIATFGA